MSDESNGTKVPLEKPLSREGGDISEVMVRRPEPGALEGLSIRDAIDMEGRTMRVLLSRITEPKLLPNELATMHVSDFVTLAAEASNFLLPRGVRVDSPPA